MNVALVCKLHGSLMCFSIFFDMLFMGFGTTGLLQTSCRLVQELNVYSVVAVMLMNEKRRVKGDTLS